VYVREQSEKMGESLRPGQNDDEASCVCATAICCKPARPALTDPSSAVAVPAQPPFFFLSRSPVPALILVQHLHPFFSQVSGLGLVPSKRTCKDRAASGHSSLEALASGPSSDISPGPSESRDDLC
jgi:hypothetical protein